MKNKPIKTADGNVIPAALLAKVLARAKLENVSASQIVTRAIQRDLAQPRVKPKRQAVEMTVA